ncbi:MAG: TolC family protein [Pirellulales bacterium]
MGLWQVARCLAWMTCIAAVVTAGCSRTYYRRQADADAYALIAEKTAGKPWAPPPDYDIQPEPRSRLYLPGCPDHPALPIPVGQLYNYELPELSPRPERPWAAGASGDALPPEVLPLPEIEDPVSTDRAASAGSTIRLVTHTSSQPPPPSQDQRTPPSATPPEAPTERPPVGDRAMIQGDAARAGRATSRSGAIDVSLVELPPAAWETISRHCLSRMFEFESIREEYRRTFDTAPPGELRETAPRLTLDDIVELALLNSREYQAQKEVLYRAALALSLQRFDYQLKPSVAGNGTAVDYIHSRNAGITTNTLAIPTMFQVDKMLSTGGTLLARFANDVVLTFNGPQGFAADVSSQLLVDISQSVFQRDILFEPLTQAERNLVYAARDLARFRKELFVNFAEDYYGLILTYRQIEINAQNYFTFVRAFGQGEAEYGAGLLGRIQLDQIEQQTLQGRSSLVQTCNGLEGALDALKFQMGIPPETPINIDLRELERLTLRDEVAVNDNLIRRARRQLIVQRQARVPSRNVMLNSAVVLIQRMLDAYQLRGRLGQDVDAEDVLQDLNARLLTGRARLEVDRNRTQLIEDRMAEPPPPAIQLFQRTMDLVDSMLELVEYQARLARRLGAPALAVEQFERQTADLEEDAAQLRDGLEAALAAAEVARLPEFLRAAESLLAEANQLVDDADALIGEAGPPPTEKEALARTIEQIDQLLAVSDEILEGPSGGLVPVEIGVDEAMLTALVLRYDLMNERGFVADDWRQIKLAADDLRSVLNLNATQIVRTDRDNNRPFDFTFDESQTQLSAELDLPLNRRAQRNGYRLALINYRAGLRSLMQLEDSIKLDVRNDLRDIQLAQTQYTISVAQAGLAYERVISTRLELQLGFPGVAARDFLEAQNDYASALSSVANNHINFIVLRTQLFLDLELLTVGPNGFWEELYEEEYQPEAYSMLQPYALPAYGELPYNVHYSEEIREMMQTMGCIAVPLPRENALPEPLAPGEVLLDEAMPGELLHDDALPIEPLPEEAPPPDALPGGPVIEPIRADRLDADPRGIVP